MFSKYPSVPPLGVFRDAVSRGVVFRISFLIPLAELVLELEDCEGVDLMDCGVHLDGEGRVVSGGVVVDAAIAASEGLSLV